MTISLALMALLPVTLDSPAATDSLSDTSAWASASRSFSMRGPVELEHDSQEERGTRPEPEGMVSHDDLLHMANPIPVSPPKGAVDPARL